MFNISSEGFHLGREIKDCEHKLLHIGESYVKWEKYRQKIQDLWPKRKFFVILASVTLVSCVLIRPFN